MDSEVQNILEHMLDDARDTMRFAVEVGSAEAFSGSILHRKAVVLSLLNIGELAGRLPVEFTEEHSEIAWRKLAGMSGVCSRACWLLDYDVIWDVVTQSIPELVRFLQLRLESR